MTNISDEDCETTLKAMAELRKRIKEDPALADEFLELMEERPKPHLLTPLERNRELSKQAKEEIALRKAG